MMKDYEIEKALKVLFRHGIIKVLELRKEDIPGENMFQIEDFVKNPEYFQDKKLYAMMHPDMLGFNMEDVKVESI